MVPSRLVGSIQVVDSDMTPSDKPVIGDHGSGDTAEQNTVGAEVVGESRRRGVEEPWVHADTDDGGDVASSSDVDVSCIR